MELMESLRGNRRPVEAVEYSISGASMPPKVFSKQK